MIYRTLFGAPGRRFSTPFADMEGIRHQMDRLYEALATGPRAAPEPVCFQPSTSRKIKTLTMSARNCPA